MRRVPGNDMKTMPQSGCGNQTIGNRDHHTIFLPGSGQLTPYFRRLLIERKDTVLKLA